VALGGSLDEVLADTAAIISGESLAEIKENANVVEAERNLILVENEMLKTKNAALTTEVELLKKEIQHKDELLALHNYYNKIISSSYKGE
jgi:hypothetical protein